jgi:hypothetical protein
MNENPKSDSYFVELIQLLPVLLEFGDRKLYDTASFGAYYPELLDEYEIKRADWNEAYYYAVENLQELPENCDFFGYLDLDFVSMIEEMPEAISEIVEDFSTEELFKQFYDEYRRIFWGIDTLFDQLEEKLRENGAGEISPLFLNLYHAGYSIDISTLKLLHDNFYSGKFNKFSKSTTIKHSIEIRDAFLEKYDHSRIEFDESILFKKSYFVKRYDEELDFYEFLFREFRHEIVEEEQPDFDLKIMANLFPLLYYDIIKQENLYEILPRFKPSTIRLIKNISFVKSTNLIEFLANDDFQVEQKILISFLQAEFNWQLQIGRRPESVVSNYLWKFFDRRLDEYNADDFLKPIYKLLR